MSICGNDPPPKKKITFSVGREIQNQDRVDFIRRRNMVIYVSLTTNLDQSHPFLRPNKRTLP